jgi:hypothetical protein
MNDRGNLVRALVSDDHKSLYMNDPFFSENIDMLAKMIPLWIDAIAEKCEEQVIEREAIKQQLEQGMMRPLMDRHLMDRPEWNDD